MINHILEAIMIEILKLAMTLKKNVCVYTCDSEISKFLYGRIIFIDNEFFALYMLTPNGEMTVFW